MDEEKILHAISDANVEKLRRANEVLEKPPWANRGGNVEGPRRDRPQPGARPFGGMAAPPNSTQDLLQQVLANEKDLQNALADARRLVDNFEDEQIRLESTIAELEARLSAEKDEHDLSRRRCEELKNILRSAAEIMVNGEKRA